MNAEMNRDIKETLESIFAFIGADIKCADYAQLQTDLERLIKRWAGKCGK